MSRAELAKCDTCGTTAPVPASALMSSPDGWFRVYGPTHAGDYCSASCVGHAFRPAVPAPFGGGVALIGERSS